MARPCKCRKIGCRPGALYFEPRAVPLAELEEVCITLDELEALRLADREGLYHEQAAQRMGVSRQTFGNIVSGARRKVADALVTGKAIKIEGGNVTRADDRRFCCRGCGHAWREPRGTGRPKACPQCRGTGIYRGSEQG